MASKYLMLVINLTGKTVKIKLKNSNKAIYKYLSFTKEQREGGDQKYPPSLKVSATTRCPCILASCKNGLLWGVLQHSPPYHMGILGIDCKSWLMLDPFHIMGIWEAGS